MSVKEQNMYKVVRTYHGGMFKENILNGATISVKGAIFQIERIYTRNGKPTQVFKFVSLSEFNENKELIEIGWNNSPAGLSKIGRELGLDYQMGSSLFSNGNKKPLYIESVKS